MKLTYDPEKRATILAKRGLDFDDAVQVFAGATLTVDDDRYDYGERRHQTLGRLNDRVVMVVWTQRGDARHIITMWKANDREKERYEARVGR